MGDLTRRMLLSQVAGTGTLVASWAEAAEGHPEAGRAQTLRTFRTTTAMQQARSLSVGDVASTPQGPFLIVPAQSVPSNPSTVFDIPGAGVQAILSADAALPDLKALAADTRPPEWFESVHSLRVQRPRVEFDLVPDETQRAHMATAGGLRLAAMTGPSGTLPPEAFDLHPARATPDPVANAHAFQTWVDAHDMLQTISLPGWKIPLGTGIDFGQRNVQGQGDGTRLTFHGLPADEDAVTLTGSVAAGERTGLIRGCAIDCQGTGRDAIRWTGGIGCGAEFVAVIAAGRDMFHFEQAEDGRFFERAFLHQCDGIGGAGRYGLCLALAPFGPDDVQFINKSTFSDTKLYGAREADVAFLLHATDSGGTDTKIGGGVLFRNFHAQYQGDDQARRGGAVLIHRAKGSNAYIDMLDFQYCTFESQGYGEGAPAQGKALEVEDETGNPGSLLRVFEDKHTLLTGYHTWWDTGETPGFVSSYRIETPLMGVRTNVSQRQYGTRTDRSGPVRVPPEGRVPLFRADPASGQMWLTSVRTAHSTNAHAVAIVLAGDQPKLRSTSTGGKLSLDVDGTEIVVRNKGNSVLNCYWSAVPLAL